MSEHTDKSAPVREEVRAANRELGLRMLRARQAAINHYSSDDIEICDGPLHVDFSKGTRVQVIAWLRVTDSQMDDVLDSEMLYD